MAFVGWIVRIVMVAAAGLLGNYVGEFVREPQEASKQTYLVHNGTGGSKTFGVRVNPIHFVPALVFAYFAGPPRTIAAFLSGALASTLLGKRFDS